MTQLKENAYFIGAGGIGMANLERYLLSRGCHVAGYDKTPSELTRQLEKEGVLMTFTDSPSEIPTGFRNPDTTFVVFTPAVPSDSPILNWFREKGFEVMKRSELLGKITRQSKSICVAGSHGKTTTTSMIANILRQSRVGCNAFLGGILRNIQSNLVVCKGSEWSVIEADEYDRSFHRLTPTIAVVTSVDPDHLDIYGDEEGYLEGFAHFTSLIQEGGSLLLHTGLKLRPRLKPGVAQMTYSGGPEGDWHAEDISYGEGKITFTLVGPSQRIEGLSPGVPVEINIDNAVAAAAAALLAGATPEEVKKGLEEFRGAKRRFEILLDGSETDSVLIDDYAHSPNEVRASIRSVKRLYPGRKLTVVFQPHLYTRTRDFAEGFSEALSEADGVIMPEIYPARELPIPGVDSQLILDRVECGDKTFCERKDLLNLIKSRKFDILMTLGAADIDVLLPEITEILKQQQGKGRKAKTDNG
ncbi:MAG: UDP-N-acetylmuramate--L-alanine ligase [Muribaculaceae bacterium]|nr:UDP-N-acetylmuramate--L-alanine ligase [Muribaculaceae bacterium]